MSVRIYMDHHVPRAVTDGVRLRGVDALTAAEDDAQRKDDPILVDRATHLGRVLVSLDEDLLAEAKRRQQGGIEFGGLIYSHQLRIRIGQFIEGPVLICELCTPEELAGTTVFLPF